MSWNVSEVARRTHLTVRTLHHYDRIGLVKPSHRTAAGYRVYAAADLLRLQQVLFFRELGFELAQVRRIMNARSFEQRQALQAQRALLTEKAARVQRMIAAIDGTLGALTRGETPALDAKEFEMFADFDPKQYEEEARQKWGQTDAFKESKRRTDAYTPADWARIKAEAAQVNAELAACMERGMAADSPEAMALAERHRMHIDRWYYPCSFKHHRGLGDMYLNDPRFAKGYEKVRKGLTQYLRDAIVANAKKGE